MSLCALAAPHKHCFMARSLGLDCTVRSMATCPSHFLPPLLSRLAGIFGAKGLKADVLSSFTVKALQPIVWTRLAQACEWK